MDATRDSRICHIETAINGRVLLRTPRASLAGVLIGFHGYAEAAEIQLQRLTDIPSIENWLLVSVQALNRFYRGRTQETVASWMTSQDRELAIATNIRYVDRVVEWLRSSPEAPADAPLVYAGFSQGTAMAFRAAVRGRFPADGVIGVCGDVPPELLEDSGSRFPRTLLIRGEHDEWYIQAKLDADVAALAARGVTATPAVTLGGHEWTRETADSVSAFLQTIAARR